jgi:hypothetical protein
MEILIQNWLPLLLFAAATVLAVRNKRLAAILSMVCGGAAVLAALVWGWETEQILTAILVPCAVSLLPLTGRGRAV